MIPDNRPDNDEIARRLNDTEGVKAALKKAARTAVQEHARAGRQIAIWRDNAVVWEDASNPSQAVEDSEST